MVYAGVLSFGIVIVSILESFLRTILVPATTFGAVISLA